MSAPLDPAALVRDRHIIVCVGTGGVGKTTLAASFALAGARLGRRTAVLTIDPARRLADALGIAELGNQPTDLPRERLTALGVPPEGRLAALMLDMKRTFDELVARFADSEEGRQRILGNRIYQHISDALAGSAEYSAMEKVFELSERRDFDLIVVDTPPSQHALDFLEAPRRLVEFLDSRLVQLLLHPALAAGRFGVRLFQRGSERVLHLIERVSGVSFLEDISEFLLAFEGMSEGFRERAREVQARLVGPDAAFVLAASPAKQSTRHALGHARAAQRRGRAAGGRGGEPRAHLAGQRTDTEPRPDRRSRGRGAPRPRRCIRAFRGIGVPRRRSRARGIGRGRRLRCVGACGRGVDGGTHGTGREGGRFRAACTRAVRRRARPRGSRARSRVGCSGPDRRRNGEDA